MGRLRISAAHFHGVKSHVAVHSVNVRYKNSQPLGDVSSILR